MMVQRQTSIRVIYKSDIILTRSVKVERVQSDYSFRCETIVSSNVRRMRVERTP